MITIAYITNKFPSPVEPYVVDEIRQLRKRGVRVIPFSVRRPGREFGYWLRGIVEETQYFRPLRIRPSLHALALCLWRFPLILELLMQSVREKQSFSRRLRALAHTWLGVYYAVLLTGRGVGHIHVHHGYFASWVAMVAARLHGIGFSMTLHGSDLLVHRAFLGTKLANCRFCLTISEFNRQKILESYPEVSPEKIFVQRMGVIIPNAQSPTAPRADSPLMMLSVGRLHPVKDHAFLIRACRELKSRKVAFCCWIAGEGPERLALESLIANLDLQSEITLLGHSSREELDRYYAMCDLVVLTSRSEGIPLVLMEAMAHGRTVLAPDITGIPELVADGSTGFLYRAGSTEDFVSRVEMLRVSNRARVQRAARQHVMAHFNREKNLEAFANCFLAQISGESIHSSYENPVLQQI